MPRKKTIEEQVNDCLKKLAAGNVSDAVSLLFMSEDEIISKLPKLNLFNVSEIRRPKGGGMEIKFFDRIKACEKLREQGSKNEESSMGFYQALEKSAQSVLNGGNCDD